jgi:hypothetical protein
VDSDETEDHVGSPDRLTQHVSSYSNGDLKRFYLMDVTSHPLATADLHIRDPKNPFPPATTSFLLTA